MKKLGWFSMYAYKDFFNKPEALTEEDLNNMIITNVLNESLKTAKIGNDNYIILLKYGLKVCIKDACKIWHEKNKFIIMHNSGEELKIYEDGRVYDNRLGPFTSGATYQMMFGIFGISAAAGISIIFIMIYNIITSANI